MFFLLGHNETRRQNVLGQEHWPILWWTFQLLLICLRSLQETILGYCGAVNPLSEEGPFVESPWFHDMYDACLRRPR